MLRSVLGLVGLIVFAQPASASILTYRFEGVIGSVADPIYAGQPPVTNGSILTGQRYTGFFDVNSESTFEPVRQIRLALSHYHFATQSAPLGEAPGALDTVAYGLTSPDIARAIPNDNYNFAQIELYLNQSNADAISAAQPVSVSGSGLAGSQLLLQLLWRDPRDNPQSLQIHASIDRVESVPEPAPLFVVGCGVATLMRRRRKTV